MNRPDTWAVWMQIPSTEARPGFSRIAGGLTREDAEKLASSLYFPGRAMPDQKVTRS